MKTQPSTVAEAYLRALKSRGVDWIFGNAGTDFAPIIEIGARLSYDLIDRAVSPYIGVHYELATGESGRLAQAGGGEKDEFFVVAGARLMF